MMAAWLSAFIRLSQTGMLIGWTCYETIELLLVQARNSLIEVVGAEHQLLLVLDVAILLLLCCSGCLVWCCVFRSVKDVALGVIQLFLCSFIALTMCGLALTLFGLTARDHPHVGRLVNQTSDVVAEQSRKLVDAVFDAENIKGMF